MKKKTLSFILLVLIIVFGLFNKPVVQEKLNQILGKKENNSTINTNIEDVKTNLEVEACNLSGDRKENSVVDIGYKKRKYYAFTNEYKQLVKVQAKEITLQTKDETPNRNRYCRDEARVEGTKRHDLDQGHALADSLGGVSNAYNITPQKSKLNRHGKQAEFEKLIRKSLKSKKKVTDFIYNITYPNKNTQIPSSYKVNFKIDGTLKSYNFDNK